MFAQLFAVIAPILICTAIGIVWARKKLPYNADFVSRLVMNVGAPCLIVSTLGEVTLPREQLGQVVIATVVGMCLLTVLMVLILRWQKLSARVYLPSLLFPNTGNMGLPLCLFAFGEQGLALALVMFIVIATSHFSLGVALVSGDKILRQLVTSPVVYAALVSLLLVLTDASLPLWVTNTIGLLGDMSIPLMLIALGISLATLDVANWQRSVAMAGLRLVGGFGVGWLVCWCFELEGVLRGVVLVQFAMPAAVFNYLLALRYQRRPDEVAGLVVCSTLASFLLLPLLLWFALPG